MFNLPLQINIEGKKAVVIGGGQVALRKVKTLLKFKAIVHVVAPMLEDCLAEMAVQGAITIRNGQYQPTDLEGAFLAIAATDDTAVNAQIAADADHAGLLTSVADAPELGNFSFPAVLQRGQLQVAVSTGGSCPSFAVIVRDYLAGIIDERYADALERLAAEREKLLTEGNGSTYNIQFVRSLAAQMIDELSEQKESK